MGKQNHKSFHYIALLCATIIIAGFIIIFVKSTPKVQVTNAGYKTQYAK